MMSKKIKKLSHIFQKTKSGAEIVLLDTGAILDAESTAMLQALHSRSTKGFRSHMKILSERGPEKFMSQFYIGYGHKSIGDLGTITLFIEGISMLAAKAIQDWPLYSGQESSTRYIDFSKQKFFFPKRKKQAFQILEKWRTFYSESLPTLESFLKEKYPIQKNEDEKIYNKAIRARSFDILRSFLPAGATTNIAWHTNLRQLSDKLLFLRNHPLAEVREIAFSIEDVVFQRYPSSFSKKRYKDTEKYIEYEMKKYYFHDPRIVRFSLKKSCLSHDLLSSREYRKIISRRPNMKTELPPWAAELGTFRFEFPLDFASYRDLQRHRSIVQRMPLLTLDLGFESWYLKNLPDKLRKKAINLLKEQEKNIQKLSLSDEEKQYLIPMGYQTSVRIIGSIPSLTYIAELRSQKTVHPTLRIIAFKIAKSLKKKLEKYGFVIFPDLSKDRFVTERGKQDIFLRKKAQ